VNLMLLEAADLSDGVAALRGRRAAHLINVLHVVEGQTVRVGLIDGPLGTGTVVSMADDSVALRCLFDASAPSRPGVDLLLALPRPKVMRRLWAQLAALGVGDIILTNADRVERHYFDTHILAPETYRPLLIEGLQQAKDTWLPRVSIHRQFRRLIEDQLDALCPARTRLVAHPGSGCAPSSAVPAANRGANDRILLAVGPEGGWNAFELGLLGAHGFTIVDAGPRPLRSDTACIALLTLVHDARRSC
jgi:RsmE family RNA methyltransferase